MREILAGEPNTANIKSIFSTRKNLTERWGQCYKDPQKHDPYPPFSKETKEHAKTKIDFPVKANAVDVLSIERIERQVAERESVQAHTKKQHQITFIEHGRC